MERRDAAHPDLDPALFDEANADPETIALNEQLERLTVAIPSVIKHGVGPVREAFEQGRGLFEPHAQSDLAAERTIDGPAGELGLRTVIAARIDGVYLHFHGGGWVMGSAAQNDERLEGIARDAGVAVVSVDYRLAPEDPYPAAADDSECAARWLVDHAVEEFGTDRIVIGGESAGGHLAATTVLRMRDRHGYTRFAGAMLSYALLDLRLTESARKFGTRPLVLNTPLCDWYANAYAGGADLADPDVSPLLADLTGFPPTLLVVGTNDPLLDDSLLMASRLEHAVLHIETGAAHGFTSSASPASDRARRAIHGWIGERVTTI